MFERYTERARRVVFYARYFAYQVGSREIEAEHLLLGLLREDMSLAQRFLGSPWALEEVWVELGQNKLIKEKPPESMDLSLSNMCKGVRLFAVEEADRISSKRIGTSHLLLGLLREENCVAAQVMYQRGVRLTPTRNELTRLPHDESIREKFVRGGSPLPDDVVESQSRIRSIMARTSAAISSHDFAMARACGEEERKERDKFFSLCQKYKLSDWLFE